MVSHRLKELSHFVDLEIDPSSAAEELPRAVALLLEASPFLDDPMAGELEASPRPVTGLEVDGPGHRIPRAVVADDLGKQILDLLWEPIAETDTARIQNRLARLRRLFDEVPTGPAACALHKRLSSGGDLIADFDYRLHRKSRADLRQGLRDRCGLTLPPDPPDPVVTPVPTPVPLKPTPTPTPTPTVPTTPATRLLEFIWELELKSESKRIKTFKNYEIHAWLEMALQVGFEGTDAERVVIKSRWQNGEFRPEMEVKLSDVIGIDFEGEWDRKPELRIKTDLKVSERVTLTPKAKLNPLEPFELEGKFQLLDSPLKTGSITFRVKGEIKGIVVVRLAWRRLLKDRVKEWLKDQFKDLADSLLRFFGGKLIKDRLRWILIGLAGLVIVKLLFDDEEQPATEDPVPVPPDPTDILAFDAVFEVAQRQEAARKRLLAEARSYRNAFAIGFGDTLAQLTHSDWRKRLANLTVIKPVGFLNLPKAGADDARAWRIWAVDAHRQRQDSVDLREDAFIRRFRTNEAALMWAILAHLTNLQTEQSVKTAIATAHQQATAAGMAAAVMHVRSIIERETYEFRDEKGQRQTRSGITTWDDMAAAARVVVPDEFTRQRRLARLVTDVLPRLR